MEQNGSNGKSNVDMNEYLSNLLRYVCDNIFLFHRYLVSSVSPLYNILRDSVGMKLSVRPFGVRIPAYIAAPCMLTDSTIVVRVIFNRGFMYRVCNKCRVCCNKEVSRVP